MRPWSFLPALLLFWIGLACAQDTRNLQVVATGEKRIALVIGNSDYTQGPLKNPVNDARAMRARLEGLGFDVILRENLKSREISSVYREFRNKITPGAVALVFYAGHGVQFKGQNYFPAIDSDINSEEDVPLQSLNLGNLLDNMEEAKAGVSLVFLDACRDNPFARKFRSASRGLAKVEAASGTLIHYATKPGSVAADGDGLNGTYTEALLAQLGEPGVQVELMLKKVTHRVTQKTSGKQEPWVEGSLRGEFYFIFQGQTTVNVQQAPADPDSSAWQAADSLGTLSAYEAYLREYPKGRHAAAARIKIGALKPGARPAVSPAPTSASSDPETAFWNEVKASGSKDYLEAYLKQYPKGKYAALAKLEMKKLDDWEKAQNEQADQEAWSQAKSENTPAAYQSYLQRFPSGSYASLAEPARQKAERELAERERQETARKQREAQETAQREEDALWQKAQAAKDSATVQGYLDRYPSGRYVSGAQSKLAAVKKEEEEMRPGKVFKDCAECPEMVVVPAGSFQMGSNESFFGSPVWDKAYKPVRSVRIGKAFALAKTEITLGQFAAFVSDSGYDAGNSCRIWTGSKWEDTAERNWRNPGFSQSESDPVACVNWEDASAYVRWLSQKSGKSYRLPSEAEWEYACRAGSSQAHCGSDNLDSVGWYGAFATRKGNSGPSTNRVATKQPNAWGLYDMSGNVWEWVQDCWNETYSGAPDDGTAWSSGNCGQRVLRGGSWSDVWPTRSFFRYWGESLSRSDSSGIRPARMLP
jgi:formylglycine-generating enzyme required for sulfatase activity